MILALPVFFMSAWLLFSGQSADLSAAQEATPAATPTIDRLAAPPTVENPNQADEGAQLYWLYCQPCHGDQAQGLTDEWRAQYPPEDQNCWESGCHGNQPYEEGFTLPTDVPPLAGEASLERFESWGEVYQFMQRAMPYQDPGSLTEEEYLAILAFLARAHDAWEGTRLEATGLDGKMVRPSAVLPAVAGHEDAPPAPFPSFVLVAILSAVVLFSATALLWKRMGQK